MVPPESDYIAFISYRHVEPDRAWARWLHRALETYRVPGGVSRELGVPQRLGRVFRDEDELPAASELRREVDVALQRSRFLIIVCSSRTPDSAWVDLEVARFIELGRADRILTLLIEGEPAASFPPALRAAEMPATLSSLARAAPGIGREPLAADVRPTTGDSVSRRKRRAQIKFAAALLGVAFDALYRREQERRARRLVASIAALAGTSALLAALAAFAFVQRNLAEQRLILAETRLADSLIREGDSQVLNDSVARARPLYAQALSQLQALSLPTLPADIALWQAEQGAAAPAFVFQGHAGQVTSVAIAPDGRTALAGSDGLIQVLDLGTWTETTRLSGHDGDYVDAVAFGPVGTNLAASAGGDGTARVWDLTSGKPVTTFSKHGAGVKAVAFTPDGRSIASAGADGAVRLWDVTSGREHHVFESDAGTIWDVQVLSDATQLVSAGNDGAVVLWDVERAKPVRVFRGHTGAVNALDVSPNGRTLITGGTDGTVRVWDLETGREVVLADKGDELIFDVAFSPSGRFALAADSAGNIELLDTESGGKPLRRLSGHVDLAGAVAYSSDLRTAVSGGVEGTAVWDLGLDTGRVALQSTAEARTVAVDPDGMLVALAGEDRAVTIRDAADGTVLATLQGGDHTLSSVAFAPDGRALVAGDEGGDLHLWSLPDTMRQRRRGAHAGATSDVAFCVDGIASAGLDGVVAFFDPGLQPIWAKQAHRDGANSVAVSADAARLVSGGRDGLVLLWNRRTGSVEKSLAGHKSRVLSVACSHDGSRVMSSDADGLVRFWTARDAGLAHAVGEGLRPETAALFAPDGRHAFSGGWNLAVTLWDVQRGTQLRKLRIDDYVNDVAISADSRIFAVAASTTVEIFDFGRAATLRTLRGRIADAKRRVAADPRDAGALATLGEWFAHAGIAQPAVDLLERAADSGARVPSVLLARMYRRLGRHEMALRWFERARNRREASEVYLTLSLRASAARGAEGS